MFGVSLCISSAALTEISDLVPETERLKQQNTELRMQLQQRLTSTVCLFPFITILPFVLFVFFISRINQKA